MKYEDFEEIPRIQQLGDQFRDQNLPFEGYLNFAISKAIHMAGVDGDQDQVTMLAAAILEAELQRRTQDRETQERKRANGLWGFIRNLKIGH